MADTQKFLDNLNGLPALWQQIVSNFAKKTDVPTKTSQLANDSGYLTNHQDVSGKLDKTGDASNTTTKFTQAAIVIYGRVIMFSLKKWFNKSLYQHPRSHFISTSVFSKICFACPD